MASFTRTGPTIISTIAVAAALTSGYSLYVRGNQKILGTLSVTAVQSGTMSGSKLELTATSGTGALSIKDSNPGRASGSILCMDAPNGTLTVCALSGGLLDCNNFQSKATLCP